MSTTLSGKRIPQLDGIRGTAILLVIIWHYLVVISYDNYNSVNSLARSLFAISWSGIDLFFVLSGYLIGGSLLDNREDPNLFRVFYTRRFFRIMPLYLLLLLPFAIMLSSSLWQLWPGMGWLFKDPLPLWSYFSFTQNFFMVSMQQLGPHWTSITWTLAIEEQFYLIMPLFIRMIPEKKLPLSLIIGILAGILCRITSLSLGSQYGAYVLLPSRMDALLLGVLVAWLVRDHARMQLLYEQQWFLNAALIVLGAGMLLFTWLKVEAGNLLILTAGATWMPLFYAVLILICLMKQNRLIDRVMSLKPLRALGTVSYFVYLFHIVILGICHALLLRKFPKNVAGADYAVTFLALCLTLIAAAISYRFIEKPLLTYAHKAKYQIS